jgi:transcriptional regulator with XRE-family HTH domain
VTENTEKITSLLKLIAANIIHLRKKRGLTQDELAVKANIDRTYIGYIENAKQNITLSKLVDIADALEVPFEHLLSPNQEVLELQDDIEKLNIIYPLIRSYQRLANKYDINDVFQDNGGKLLKVLLVTGLLNLKGREGNDARDTEGNEYELKSVNTSLTKQFSTHHHLSPTILAKYRKVSWIFAVYAGIELREIYKVAPKQLEEYFSKWERICKKEKRQLNNPKIPLTHVRKVGKLLFELKDGGQFYRIKL